MLYCVSIMNTRMSPKTDVPCTGSACSGWPRVDTGTGLADSSVAAWRGESRARGGDGVHDRRGSADEWLDVSCRVADVAALSTDRALGPTDDDDVESPVRRPASRHGRVRLGDRRDLVPTAHGRVERDRRAQRRRGCRPDADPARACAACFGEHGDHDGGRRRPTRITTRAHPEDPGLGAARAPPAPPRARRRSSGPAQRCSGPVRRVAVPRGATSRQATKTAPRAMSRTRASSRAPRGRPRRAGGARRTNL